MVRSMQLLALIVLVSVSAVVSIPTWLQSPGLHDSGYQHDIGSTSQLTLTSTEHGVLSSKPIVGLCDDVKQYAGYFNVTTATKFYFYWFFESRSNPATDPVVLWLTGGPGCSSSLALFNENGPCQIQAGETEPTRNPWGWNANASLLFVDQPAGVGFSYGGPRDYDSNEDQVSLDMLHLLEAFFQAFPARRANPFHIFGESYGGHFVPATARRVFEAGRAAGAGTRINLRGVGVGNGLTVPEIQYRYYSEMARHNPVRPLVPAAEYDVMRAASAACVEAIRACQAAPAAGEAAAVVEPAAAAAGRGNVTAGGKDPVCESAMVLCSLTQVTPVQLTGVNLYDIRRPCGSTPLCYDFSATARFLSRPDVQAALGVTGRGPWEACNMEVNSRFHRDWMNHFQVGLPDMLAAGIRVLIYAGDVDFICNYLGNQAWTLAMPWPGQAAFKAEGEHPWLVSGRAAGLARSAEGFTFLRVFDAGHMVPMDQPEVSLAMLNQFLAGEPFY